MRKRLLLIGLLVVGVALLSGCDLLDQLIDQIASGGTTSGVVNFPDPGLEAAIREAIAKPVGDIYDTDLIGLTTLDAQSRGIADLEGIQYCTDLRVPWLLVNQISDITLLAGLTNITHLHLGRNPIVDITPLAGLINLTQLQLGVNQINDIAPLAGLINLTQLYLANSQISNIAPLAGLINLTELGLWQNQISDITPLAGLTNLARLDLHRNQIRDIAPLAGLINLSYLQLRDNSISSVAPLVSNSGIDSGDSVDLRDNDLSQDPGSDDMADINTLIDRGVQVDY
jgi:Leucine-rich repeat (LRR) protein